MIPVLQINNKIQGFISKKEMSITQNDIVIENILCYEETFQFILFVDVCRHA